MPQVLVIKKLLFMIHTRDEHSPAHVEVYYGTPTSHQAWAKINIEKVAVLESENFSSKDLDMILRITQGYQKFFSSKWKEYNGTRLQK